LITASAFLSSKTLARTSTLFLVLTMLASAKSPAQSQSQTQPQIDPAAPTPTKVMLSLPDAPGFSSGTEATSEFSSSDDDTANAANADDTGFLPGSRHHLHLASRREITIQPGQTAPSLSQGDKVSLGLRESFTLFSVIGWTASAGYSQLTNGSPNFGTDSGAFGERLGATSLRLISQNILGNALFSPIFHDDPRYYKMGSGHNIVARTLYAGTRAVITKSDDGRTRLNYSLLSGHLAGAALTNTYYPSVNRGFEQTAKTFGTSMGGSAFGFVVTEFLDDLLTFAHLQKLE
jgi:hypothetical protein